MRWRLTSRWLDTVILLGVTSFILWHLSPQDMLRNTTAVGGDTPAHNYIASHLRHQLFHHGRIISWANGWWGGFPLFQYYFPLPYLLMAFLSLLIPFNIAFKFITISGLLALPVAAYAAMRLLRFPRPTPIIAAVLCVPFLFVRDHTMWGVNVASTLAGMISNSLSFALMIPAMASIWRDVTDSRFRLRSVFLLTLVMASHFFTSVMIGLTLLITPLLLFLPGNTHSRRRQFLILATEGALALLLMSWWLVPLIAKSAWSMDFGVNWGMTLWKNFPPWTAALLPLGLLAILFTSRPLRLLFKSSPDTPPCSEAIPPLPPGERAGVRVHPKESFLPPAPPHSVWLFVWMLTIALALFYFGYDLSPVFVNCRLWPFIMFALIMLGSAGLGLLLARFKNQALPVLLTTVLILGATAWNESQSGSLARHWSSWNFKGLEIKPSGGVFDELVLPLQGTPGRLANDLHPDNDALGSSRVFELVPHLIGKPILEGGLVNSSIGSMFAYYIESETSESCAGYPPIVKPSSFNMSLATRHLELFNVKHFIARSPATQQALRADPRWKFIQREEEWELYELLSHDGSYVFIPKFLPAILETTNPNQRGMDWIYVPGALDQPFILTAPSTAIKLPATLPRLSESEFQSFLKSASSTNPAPAAWQVPIPSATGAPVSAESVTDDSIRFKTRAIGQPHIIKINYFPNWQVRGASGVFRVTPSFLLVFPTQEQVELFYGSTPSDTLGRWLTILGWLLIGMIAFRLLGCKTIRR